MLDKKSEKLLKTSIKLGKIYDSETSCYKNNIKYLERTGFIALTTTPDEYVILPEAYAYFRNRRNTRLNSVVDKAWSLILGTFGGIISGIIVLQYSIVATNQEMYTTPMQILRRILELLKNL